MSPTNRLAWRRPLPLPQIFSPTRFPDVAQIMENALGLFPDLPEMTDFTRMGVFPAENVTEKPETFIVTA